MCGLLLFWHGISIYSSAFCNASYVCIFLLGFYMIEFFLKKGWLNIVK